MPDEKLPRNAETEEGRGDVHGCISRQAGSGYGIVHQGGGPGAECVLHDSRLPRTGPEVQAHRNVDAVRLAKLMSQVIKGRLCWRFIDDAAYDSAIETLRNEQGAHTECRFMMRDPPNPGQ